MASDMRCGVRHMGYGFRACLWKAFPMWECSDRNRGGKVVKGFYTRRTPREIVMIVSAFCKHEFPGKRGKGGTRSQLSEGTS